jgi:hypothetical protein
LSNADSSFTEHFFFFFFFASYTVSYNSVLQLARNLDYYRYVDLKKKYGKLRKNMKDVNRKKMAN